VVLQSRVRDLTSWDCCICAVKRGVLLNAHSTFSRKNRQGKKGTGTVKLLKSASTTLVETSQNFCVAQHVEGSWHLQQTLEGGSFSYCFICKTPGELAGALSSVGQTAHRVRELLTWATG